MGLFDHLLGEHITVLPQIKTPTYELEVPSTGLKITQTVFGKGTKVLMIEQEQGEKFTSKTKKYY